MPETTNPTVLTVNVTIAVETNGWSRDYGIEGAPEIRNDVQAFLTEALRTCNENITLVEPFAMTVTEAKNLDAGRQQPLADGDMLLAPGQLDALLDAATEADCSDIVLRPGEAPLFISKAARVEIPGYTEPLDPESLATETRRLLATENLPSNFFGTFPYRRPGTDYKAFTDSAMTQFRAAPSEPTPLTYTFTREARPSGNSTTRTDHFVFSDGDAWDITTRTHTTANGDFEYMDPSTATRNGAHAHVRDFHAKLATARAADEQPEPALTYIVTREESTNGDKHWDNALYTFSDGEVWEVVTEWTQGEPGPAELTATEATTWIDGIPKEAPLADFQTKIAASTPRNA